MHGRVPSLKPQLLAPGDFGEGGCLVDLDGDGPQEFVSVEGTGSGRLRGADRPIGSRS